MNTILWIIKNLSTILLTSVVVIFQPELRKMLEQLGQKKFMASIFPLDAGKEVQERFTDKTINELVKACFDMGEVRTGALIVIEQNIRLSEYERTGINVDAVLTSQLLINIFEHNTPLHDGAVLVRGNRIVAATCYLPLSDNMELSKELGTRHRAAVGISEVSDSLTIVVSEETGKVSIALDGELYRNVDAEFLKNMYQNLQIFNLGSSLDEMSKNIFTDLRKADKTNADLIIIQGVSTDGLGLAIMNRLLRACNFNIIR